MILKETFISGRIQYRLLRHFLFWILSFYLLLYFFAYEDRWYVIDYVYTALFHISLVVGVYLNLLWLVPRLLIPRPSIWYLPAFIGCLLLTACLNQFSFDYLSNWLAPSYYFISYYTFSELLLFAAAYLGISSLLHLSRSRFTLIETEQQIQRLRKEKLQAELQALKAQLNPHFLFNSLNSIYYLAMEEQERSPAAILQLSQVMRYVLHDANNVDIELEKEIQFLRDYIDLQRLRTDQSVPITFEVQGDSKGKKIAPLLLIPFVENAFKHGIKGNTESPFVELDLQIESKKLIFRVKNNQGEVDDSLPEMPGGLGLQNVRRRLELLYPDRHQLQIVDQDSFFETELILDL